MSDGLLGLVSGIAGVLFGAGVVYGTVREKLRTLDTGQQELARQIAAHRREASEAIAKIERLVIAILQRPEYDRRRQPRHPQ